MTEIDIFNGKWIIGDCLEKMKDIPDNSIDMILCDLPYGTTACKWDTIIPFDKLWEQYDRIGKKTCNYIFTASQPFTSKLIISKIEYFRYEIIWEKSNSTGHVHANNKPLKHHENICVFSKGYAFHKGKTNNRMIYNPQGLISIKPKEMDGKKCISRLNDQRVNPSKFIRRFTNYPKSLIKFKSERGFHPTQKPVSLFEYLIKTYSNEGDLILDNCAGSGTTAIACENLNSKWICIEQDEDYSNQAIERILQHKGL